MSEHVALLEALRILLSAMPSKIHVGICQPLLRGNSWHLLPSAWKYMAARHLHGNTRPPAVAGHGGPHAGGRGAGEKPVAQHCYSTCMTLTTLV